MKSNIISTKFGQCKELNLKILRDFGCAINKNTFAFELEKCHIRVQNAIF